MVLQICRTYSASVVSIDSQHIQNSTLHVTRAKSRKETIDTTPFGEEWKSFCLGQESHELQGELNIVGVMNLPWKLSGSILEVHNEKKPIYVICTEQALSGSGKISIEARTKAMDSFPRIER